MKHKFSKVKIEFKDGQCWLCLGVLNAPMAQQELCNMKDRLYIADIKQYREKRSNKANAYAWSLISQLAVKLKLPREEVYRQYIPEVGKFKMLYVPDDLQRETVENLWKKQGLGWLVDDAGGGYLMCHYGSSTFDTEQMSRFINMIVDDCKTQGIETETPEQLSRYIEDWKGEQI